MLKYLFWILWTCELLFMIWWLLGEMKLKYLSMNPMVPVGFVILFTALLLKLAFGMDKVAMWIVAIPGTLLAIMGIFALVILIMSLILGPIRWN